MCNCLVALSCLQLVNGDMYPPTVAEALVNMSYPPSVPLKNQLAIGQEVYGLLPGLIMYATIWLREHNRVCDILKAEHPTWSDEQLFQTTRLIIIGKNMPGLKDGCVSFNDLNTSALKCINHIFYESYSTEY